MDWKSWLEKLIKKPIFVVRGTIIKKKPIKKRCQEEGRVLTEEQALEFRKQYEGIPLDMLELVAECGCYVRNEQKRNRFFLSKTGNHLSRILFPLWKNYIGIKCR